MQLLGGDALAALDRQGKLLSFLAQHEYQGAPLTSGLGGWLRQGMPFRGKQMVCSHEEWAYFSREFDIPCVDFIEPKPGIPPPPSHIEEIIARMRRQTIPVVFSTNYYSRDDVLRIAAQTGAKAVIVPGNVGGTPGVTTYRDLLDTWVSALAQAFASGPTAP